MRAEDVALDTPVDLVVNDTNLDPEESAGLMLAAARLLRPGAPAVLTVKLGSVYPWPGIGRAHRLVGQAYEVIGTRHLPHNRQEVTTLLRRRADHEATAADSRGISGG